MAFVTGIAIAMSGCSSCRSDDQKKTAREQLPPLAAPSPVALLPVEGFADAVTVIPVGITRPAPVVVAVIGIGDTPEEQCATWKELVGQRAFVLCPRGLPHWVRPETPDDKPEDQEAANVENESPTQPDAVDAAPKQVGFFMPDLARLEKETLAGVAALEKRYGQHVAAKELLYAGFSRGAFLGAQLVAKKPDRFKRAILVEGGHSPWTESSAASFARGGGKRILFVCGQQSCVDDAANATAALAKQKVDTRTAHGQGEGHGYKKQVKEEMRRSLEWIVEGDPLWRQLLAQ